MRLNLERREIFRVDIERVDTRLLTNQRSEFTNAILKNSFKNVISPCACRQSICSITPYQNLTLFSSYILRLFQTAYFSYTELN